MRPAIPDYLAHFKGDPPGVRLVALALCVAPAVTRAVVLGAVILCGAYRLGWL